MILDCPEICSQRLLANPYQLNHLLSPCDLCRSVWLSAIWKSVVKWLLDLKRVKESTMILKLFEKEVGVNEDKMWIQNLRY